MSRNRLTDETSPYLLQHKDNPVHWWAWGDDAFAEAKSTGKPILLSVGYAACHWCHVMAHESFEDGGIAALMNDLFINIKVDREERPDVDSIYQSALGMMGEHGGWPLTMFLTPDGDPYWGGTYFPPAPRYGRPGFPQLLESAAEAFHQRPDQVNQNVTALKQGLENMAKPNGGGELSIEDLDSLSGMLLQAIDPLHGGTSGAPKFPTPSLFQFLWRAYRRTASPLFRDAVTLTLNNICQGGIYDHVGGGLARYAVDDVWLAPHFEKMLYDNAQMVELLTDAWLDTRSPLYAVRIQETVEWALRELRDGEGPGFAFVSAYDADSEGEEGKFYVWSEAEVDAVLGDDAPRFKEIYDVTPHGNWEGHTILNRSKDLALADGETEALLARCRAQLFDVRKDRVWPQRDDKVLADWNGLMISALVRAGTVFGREDWLQAARDVFAFVRDEMTEDGRLRHSWCDGRLAHPATIDDYANMARAAMLLFEWSSETAYLDQAQEWVAIADKHYWDPDAKGYFLAADDTTDLITRPKTIHDNAVPPGNGTLVEVLARLWLTTGDAGYRARADELLAAFTPEETKNAVHQSTFLNGFEILSNAVQIVIVGDPAAEAVKTLRNVADDVALPTRIVIQITDPATLPEAHPAAGKGLVDGKPAAYVCRGATCGLPALDADTLRGQLENP